MKTSKTRISGALIAAVTMVFIGFVIAMSVLAFLLMRQNTDFNSIFLTDFNRVMIAADLAREAETLNAQILDRAFGIDKSNSEQSLLDTPQIAIFRDKLKELQARNPGPVDISESVGALQAPYLEGIGNLDASLRAEENLRMEIDAIVEDLHKLMAVLRRHDEQPQTVNLALEVLTDISGSIVTRPAGQQLRLAKSLDENLTRLQSSMETLPTNHALLAPLHGVEDIAKRIIAIRPALMNTPRITLALLRDIRKSSQKINGATFNYYLDRRDDARAAMERHSNAANIILAIVLAFGLASTVTMAVVIRFINRRVARRLDHLAMTMVAHMGGERPHIPTDGNDEISEIGRAFAVFVQARDAAESKLVASQVVLAEEAVTDQLSGLTNRRGFDEIMNREWRRCGRSGLFLSLLLVDIDHFKLYNDHYGHVLGDECIRRVARVLRAALGRPGDSVARYGGEEFACIMPDSGHEGSIAIAETIRRLMMEEAIPHQSSNTASIVTVSIGVASIIPSDDLRHLVLVEAADHALYAAKAAGRNRVICTEDIKIS